MQRRIGGAERAAGRMRQFMCNKPALLWTSGLRCGRANRDGGISAGVYLPFGRGVSGGQAGTHGRRDALAEHCRQLCRKRKGNMERGNGENGLQKQLPCRYDGCDSRNAGCVGRNQGKGYDWNPVDACLCTPRGRMVSAFGYYLEQDKRSARKCKGQTDKIL